MQFLLFLAAASVVSADAFSISVFAPNTAVDGTTLHAAKESFYSGIAGPATSCPLKPASNCPKVAGTLVSSMMGAMEVMVPGGQQTYVRADGQVKFTKPHSAYIPESSIIHGWVSKTIVSDCLLPKRRDVIDFYDGQGHGGVALCPDVPRDMDGTGASFLLYAKTEGFNLTGCIDILGLTLTKSVFNVGCYQYQ
ncbi:hypothetical protein F4861DRAFT_534426 [Xylaria intraflava]|nr:hypothetical protein F4861DRAFT_534426 [Xylaria intraflava]